MKRKITVPVTGSPFVALARKKWAMLLSVGTGGLGGWALNALNVPLGWLIGSMLATGALALMGLRPRMPGVLRWMVMAVIGVYLGAAFSPEVLNLFPRSVVSIIVMLLVVTVEVFFAAWLFTKIMRCNAITAYAACMPGGFSTMLLIAQEHGGDPEVVSLVQLVRVIVVIFSIMVIAYLLGVDLTEAREQAVPNQYDLETYGLAFAVFLVGLGTGIMLKMPIVCMVLPAVLVASLQVAEVSELHLHTEPLSIALVFLGASIGSRWGSLKAERVFSCVFAGLLLAIFLVGFSLLSAWVVSDTLFIELVPTIMAYSPGGVAEISLIALALDIDPAFVGMHHIVRIFYILLMMPLAVAYMKQAYMTDEK